MSIAKSSIKLSLTRGSTILIGFFGTIYFSRALGANILGIYFLFYSVLSLFALISNLGLDVATVKRLSERKDSARYLAASLILHLLPLIIISPIIYFLGDRLDSFIGIEIAVFMIFILVVTQLYSFVISALRGSDRVAESGGLELLKELTRVVSQILLVAFGAGIYGMIYGVGIGLLISIAVGAIIIEVGLVRPKIQHYKSLLSYSRYSYINAVSGYVYEWIDIVVIGIFLTSSYVGVYGIAWNLSLVSLLLSEAIALTIFPKISELSFNKKNKELRALVQEGYTYTTLITIPAFFGAIILSKDILRIIFGPEFEIGWLILIVLLAARIFHSLQMITVRTLEAIDRPKIGSRISIIATFLNLLGDILLVYYFGFLGAAIATLLTMLVFFSFGYYILHQYLGAIFPHKEYGYQLLASVFMGVGVLAVSALIHEVTLPDLLFLILLGGIVYFASLSALSMEVRSKTATLINELINR